MDSSHLPHFDVIIIGAGPSGSVAATMLARAGLSVALIEQSRFPRDKVCGECLSAMGIQVLRRLGLLSGLESHQPTHLTRSQIHATDGTALELQLPHEMLGISRRVLDDFLLAGAKDEGAVVFQPARVEKLQPGCVSFRDLVSNRFNELHADLVVLADGKGAFSARSVPPSGDMGVKCHLRGIDAPRNAIELFGVPGHYTGLAPIEEGLWNLAFSIPSHRVLSARGDLDSLLDQMRRQNKALDARLRFTARASDWLTCPLPRFCVAPEWEEHFIPLGNAAAALEPIGGEGMGLAMRSAELTSEEIIAARAQDRRINYERLRQGFQSLWRVRQVACRSAALAISQPRLATAVVSVLRKFPQLHHSAMRLLGKA